MTKTRLVMNSLRQKNEVKSAIFEGFSAYIRLINAQNRMKNIYS